MLNPAEAQRARGLLTSSISDEDLAARAEAAGLPPT